MKPSRHPKKRMVSSMPAAHYSLYAWASRMKVRGTVFGLLCIFCLSTLSLLLVWSLAPTAHRGVKPSRFPRHLEELKVVAEFLKDYRDEHYIYTLFMFSLAYLYKQTFAIPGSFFMNLLAGALFGRWLGGVLVCPLTSMGASFCYLLSWTFAAPLLEKYFVETIRRFKMKVEENEHRLLWFLLGARIFPFTPHWLVNISSPFLGVPLPTFSLSVLLGVAPYNFLCVRAGGILADLKSASDVLDAKTLCELLLIALVVLGIGMKAKKRTPPIDADGQQQEPLVTTTHPHA
ncbi:unnamed protein product, partial [Mesorhabditis spiculigera]